MTRRSYFVTGATGLIGRAVVARLLQDIGVDRVYVLVRAPSESSSPRVIPVVGDVRRGGLGISREERARLESDVHTVVHSAASTSFSQTIAEARATNRDGTARMLELSADWPLVSRWVYVSTAFVAGLRTGVVREDQVCRPPAWANDYEQSKWEAEALVRAARDDWAIARPATVVCDDVSGQISQTNAVHRALRLYFGGLAAMLPGVQGSALDVVTTDYVARGVTRVALSPDVERRTYHFCAGARAMPLADLLDVSYDAFLRAPAWRRKGIVRPERTDLATYRMFEDAMAEAGSDRVQQAVRSLGHFVPQLAHPKQFETTNADRLLGEPAPAVASFWTNMVERLVGASAIGEAA